MRQAHQQLREEQDQHLEEINEVADRLKIGSKNINNELTKQEGLIKDLDQGIDDTMSKMNFVQKKLSKLLKTNGNLMLI